MIKRFVRWYLRRNGINLCHLCDAVTENTLGGKLTCYGHEHDARMWQLYGEDF